MFAEGIETTFHHRLIEKGRIAPKKPIHKIKVHVQMSNNRVVKMLQW